jgi:hypothetical protein
MLMAEFVVCWCCAGEQLELELLVSTEIMLLDNKLLAVPYTGLSQKTL